MKKRKILSLLLSLCLLISLLPTVALAADQTNDGAGIRIVQGDAYDSSTGIFSIKVQAKLPAGTGITTIGTLLSYDNTKLAVVNKNNTSKDVTSDEGVIKNSSAIIKQTFIGLVDGDDSPVEYTITDQVMYKEGNRSAIYTYHANVNPIVNKPTDAQTGGNWFDVYEVMFRVAGKPADPATVLNSDSLRIADATKGDDAVIKGAHPANNIYSIYLTDNSDPAKLYVLNRMSGCTETEVTGEKSLMTAPGTGIATYPGSTNSPSATTKTLDSIAVTTAPTKTTYTAGENFNPAGMVVTATYSDTSTAAVTSYTVTDGNNLVAGTTSVTISYTEGSVTKTCTQAITVNAVTPPAPTEYTITFNGNGGTPSVGTMSTAGGKLTSLPTATRSGSYSFDGWYTAASGGTQITTAYVFSANTTVYAHWTYTGGGGSYYAPVVPDMPMLYRGCTGDAVKTLQEKLNAKGFDSGNVDGIFGAKTYAAATAFQKANGLGVDGIVGKLTWAKLYDATPVNVTPVTTQPMLRTGSRGDAVRKLQELLNAKGYTCGSVDGIFGSKTYAAVLAFQKANGLAADGIVGSLTWGKLV